MGAHPLPNNVTPLLTDYYEITMAYGYWKTGKHEDQAAFDAFFRKNPFHGEYTIFAGLEDVLNFVKNYKFSTEDIKYLEKVMGPETDPDFFVWLSKIDCSRVRLYALHEGSVVFPRLPVIRVEGPLAICQLLETTILNLTNYASLVATNASRMRIAAGFDKALLEFGLRRAQGPNGGMSASRYSFIGGFDGTSNCLAGRTFDIGVGGTHAHSFVCSFKGPDDLKIRNLDGVDLFELALSKRKQYEWESTHLGELASFVAYAISFPNGFLALVDTYDTLLSGVPNFLAVAAALVDLGKKPVGIRLDSGDLAYLSKESRRMFKDLNERSSSNFDFGKMRIVASNDLNETVIRALQDQGHEIDTFGVGTNLVTCQAQPALGMVYKLVEINDRPCIKLSNEFSKVTLPGRKMAYRFFSTENIALCDYMTKIDETAPKAGQKILCQHPTAERKRMYVIPTKIVPLHNLYFTNGEVTTELPSIKDIKKYVMSQLKILREDHFLTVNPTNYKVSVSTELFDFIQDLWLKEAPIKEFR